MNSSLRSEIDSCIRELESIACGLRETADSITRCIEGMETDGYVRALRASAEKYEEAARKLRKIQ